jgi:hypothetical protein
MLQSPSSNSDDIGLAYADSEYSDTEEKERVKKAPPPALDLPSHPAPHIQSATQRKPPLKKADSASSSNGLERSNSTKIARALGLTQVEGRTYRGGPGSPTLTRQRSPSQASTKSAYSARSANSRSGRQPDMYDDNLESTLSGAQVLPLGGSLAKSKSTSSASSGINSLADGITLAQRSKTVSSPDSKTPKLPGRSKTPDARNGRGGEERVEKKRRVCLGCAVIITDGRWVQMDGGRILCEKCWKNMYLPKVSFV